MRAESLLSCRTTVDFARLRLAARALRALAGMIQSIRLPRNGRPRLGFTLLEVMAAVALLGTAYTVLGGAGIQGLQHEGESRRRIQASLLADALLAELEASADTGLVAQPGKDQRHEGEFTVEIEVAPLDLVVPDDPNPLPAVAIGGSQPTGAQPNASQPSQLGGKQSNVPDALAASLIHGEGRSVSPLRRITVTVGWTEGWGDRSVVRTTYAFDAESVKSELEALDGTASATANAGQAAGTGQTTPQGQTPQQPTGNPVTQPGPVQ